MKSTHEAFGDLSRALLRLRRVLFVELIGPMRQFRLHLFPLSVVYLAGVLAVGAFLSADPSSTWRRAAACALGVIWWGGLVFWLRRLKP